MVFGIVVAATEEVAWRGYAQPRLAARYGPFGAAVLVGVAWCLWHVPMFLGQGVPMDLFLLMLLFFIFFIGGSLLLGWIHHGTGGSLLVVSLAHLGAHLNNSHRALPDEALPVVAHAIVYAALGMIVMRGEALPAARRPAPTSR